tara:strand:+ start:18410 stop:19648 length:1239 start_codon:yes stop_codon:yes gene_type:complete
MSLSTFSSSIFETIWKKHFIPKKPILSFDFIEGVRFYKSNFSSLMFNVGKNLTKGNHYTIKNEEDYKGKAFVIYDVLIDSKMEMIPELEKKLKLYKSKQYPGFLIELDKYADVDAYLLDTFGKSSRMKMRKYTKRLETCFDISSKMFYGHIDKEEYDAVFEGFIGLLERRYSDKQISNNNMGALEWKFYKDVAYPLILEKKASLFVLYDGKKPIAVTYNYHSNKTVVDAITVFDIDYAKFNIGYVNNLKLLGWCFDNKIKALDFSKGYFDYKKRMCTLEYDFEHHILYDGKSIKACTLAFLYFKFYEFKFYLRQKDINMKFHKLIYLIFNRKKEALSSEIKITDLEILPENDTLTTIDYRKKEFSFLRKPIYDFQYITTKHKNNINVYKTENQKNTYIISSKDLIQQITLKK